MKRACVLLPKKYTSEDVKISGTVLSALVDSLWSECKTKFLFRYEIGEQNLRTVPGSFGFCVDQSQQRFTKKRPAHEISRCDQPFDEELFNFNKLKDDEILLNVDTACDLDIVNISLQHGDDLIAINDSPISQNHILIIPDPKQKMNQVCYDSF